jgi:predicted MFS family arabinose efflux permease
MIGGVLLLGHAGSATAIVVAGVLCGLGHAFVFPILSALVVSRAHDDNRGVAMTLFTCLFDVGALVGAPILGFVIEASDYSSMFTVAAGVVLAFSFAFYFMDRPRAAT